MLKVTKYQSEHGYVFDFETIEGKFTILFCGNLDLYWMNNHGNISESPETMSYTITKENYYIYSLFNELYKNVKKTNIFEFDEIEETLCNEEETEASKKRIKELNNNIRKREKYNPKRLFKDNMIQWHCDDFDYDEASVLKIKKEKDKFIVIFEKSKVKDLHLRYAVRFRNSGSRYEPFNDLFMKMYNKLIDYDPEYHQIHIEEYLYQKKQKKLKKLY